MCDTHAITHTRTRTASLRLPLPSVACICRRSCAAVPAPPPATVFCGRNVLALLRSLHPVAVSWPSAAAGLSTRLSHPLRVFYTPASVHRLPCAPRYVHHSCPHLEQRYSGATTQATRQFSSTIQVRGQAAPPTSDRVAAPPSTDTHIRRTSRRVGAQTAACAKGILPVAVAGEMPRWLRYTRRREGGGAFQAVATASLCTHLPKLNRLFISAQLLRLPTRAPGVTCFTGVVAYSPSSTGVFGLNRNFASRLGVSR
jgi:hypothetical protein